MPTVDMSNVEVPLSLYGETTHVDAAAPVRPSVPPVTRRRRGAFWALIVVAVGIVVAGVFVAVSADQAQSEPAGVVARYFDALANGDASGALGFGAVPDGDRRFLTADVLHAQLMNGTPGNVSVLSQDVGGSTATVHVQYRLSGGANTLTVNDTIPLSRVDGVWRLDRVAVPIHPVFSGASDRVVLMGGSIPVSMDSFLVFAGAVPFTMDTPNLTIGKESLAVRFAVPEGGDPIAVVPSEAARRALTAELTEQFKACLDGTSAVQTLCPVPDGTRDVPGSLRGTLVGSVEAAAKVAVDNSDGGVMEIMADVSVEGTHRVLDFNNIVSTATLKGQVALNARALATDPTRLVWGR